MTVKKIIVSVCIVIFMGVLLCSFAVGNTRSIARLNDAIEEQDYSKFQNELKRVSDLNSIAEGKIFLILGQIYGKTPLQKACEVGNYQMVKDLVEAGADINYTVEKDAPFSPLMLAATSSSQENADIVAYLLEQDADVSYRKSEYDADVLYQMAVSQNDIPNMEEIFDMLVQTGADLQYQHPTYPSLVYNAAVHRNDALVRHLIQAYQMDVEQTTEDGNSILIAYCQSSLGQADVEIVSLLLDCGVDPFLKNQEGKTAYDYSVEKGYGEIASLLEKRMTEISNS